MHRSPMALAALATVAVPGLDVVATQTPQHTTADFAVSGVLDSGGRRWVVRCPLHPAAGASLEGEISLLERLGPLADDGTLPFDVPRPEGFAPLSEGGRAVVYPALPGRRLDLGHLAPGAGLAADLGRALAAVHELPARLVEDAGLPVYDADAYRQRCLAEVDAAARTGHVPSSLLQRWEQALEDVALWRFQTTPVHGDLAEEHVLVSGGTVAAVLSWSEAHVGDPAQDLAWLLAAAPAECLDTIEEAYALARREHADPHLLDRALLVSELALARWLLHGVRGGEEAVVADATGMLAVLADQTADEPPIGYREPIVVPGGGPASGASEGADDDVPYDDVAEDDVAEDGAPDDVGPDGIPADAGADAGATPTTPAVPEAPTVPGDDADRTQEVPRVGDDGRPTTSEGRHGDVDDGRAGADR